MNNLYTDHNMQMSDHHLIKAIDAQILGFIEMGHTPALVEIGECLIDDRSIEEWRAVKQFTAQGLSLKVRIEKRGWGIRISDSAEIPNIRIKPIWGHEQLWMNESGNKVLVKFAPNTQHCAFRKPDEDEWEFLTLNDLYKWGFSPGYPGALASKD